MSRIVISGGTVITASGAAAAEVLVDGEQIAALAAPGSAQAAAQAAAADRVLDASGRYVLPGVEHRMDPARAWPSPGRSRPSCPAAASSSPTANTTPPPATAGTSTGSSAST
jgi:hypothetical protein